MHYQRPEDEYGLKYHKDLGYYMRNRYARYVAALKEMAQEYGVKGIPFLINIHGTGGGRGHTFPIGISQLMESYTQSPDYFAGSDIYLSGVTMENLQDIYICNQVKSSFCYLTPERPVQSFLFFV